MRWTKAHERRLVELHEMGLTFKEIGKILNRSENSVEGRWKKIKSRKYEGFDFGSSVDELEKRTKQLDKTMKSAVGIKNSIVKMFDN